MGEKIKATMTDSIFMWNKRTCEHGHFSEEESTVMLTEGWRRIEPAQVYAGTTNMYDKHGNLHYVPDHEVAGVGNTLSTVDPVSLDERARRKAASLDRIKARTLTHD